MPSPQDNQKINTVPANIGNVLQRLARDKSEHCRTALVEAVTNLHLSSDDGLKAREKKLVFDILAELVRETEMSVRSTISARLSEMNDAPLPLIRFLANDEIEIAHPTLSKSRVLADGDLVKIIKNRTIEHQLSIAIRRNVGETVSNALVEGKITASSSVC